MAPTPSAADDHSGAGDAAEATSHARPHLPVRLWRFLNETWRDYWWRGLKLAWRARWPFWLPVGLLLLNFTVWVLQRAAEYGPWLASPHFDEPRPSVNLESLGESAALGARFAAFSFLKFDSVLRLGGHASLVVLFAFTASLWLRVVRRRPRSSARPLVAAGLVAVIALGARLLAYGLRHSPYVDLSGPVNLLQVFRILGWARVLEGCYGLVARAAMTGLIASLFWSAVRGEQLGLRRSLKGAAEQFWPLLLFYVVCHFPNDVFLPWLGGAFHFEGLLGRFAAHVPASLLSAIGYVVIAWTMTVPLVGLPFPFLAMSEKGSVRATLKRLATLYRQRWKRVVVLWAVTVVLIAQFSFAIGMVVPFWRTLLPWKFLVWEAFFALSFAASIGGVMGMFLLIEDWRASRTPVEEGEQG